MPSTLLPREAHYEQPSHDRGGDAIADTQWTIANAQGETVKETVGALPTHIFAPGTYTASARNAGEVFHRQFAVQAGDAVQVEVMRR